MTKTSQARCYVAGVKRWLSWYAVLLLGVWWSLSFARELRLIPRSEWGLEHVLLYALVLPLPFVLTGVLLAWLLNRPRSGANAPSAAD